MAQTVSIKVGDESVFVLMTAAQTAAAANQFACACETARIARKIAGEFGYQARSIQMIDAFISITYAIAESMLAFSNPKALENNDYLTFFKIAANIIEENKDMVSGSLFGDAENLVREKISTILALKRQAGL